MKNNLFKEEHLYGHILKFLYDNADKKYDMSAIHSQFEKADTNYLIVQIKYLEKDELIIKDDLPVERIEDESGLEEDIVIYLYRISHKGFLFIKELENSQRSGREARMALIISAITTVITIAGLWISLSANSSATELKYGGQSKSIIDSGRNFRKDTIIHEPHEDE